MQADGLLGALFGKTRRSILTLMFGHTEESFHLRKILRLAGVSPGAGQRELQRLSDAGILVRTVKDNQVLFQANPQCPIFVELRTLISKTAGLVDILRNALEPLGSGLKLALVYGSMASGRAITNSDIDLLVVGDISFEDVVRTTTRAQEILRREINPLVMSLSEFKERISQGDHLIDSILTSPVLPVLGDAGEFSRLAQ
jgi:predicted nucleotidyltransferase